MPSTFYVLFRDFLVCLMHFETYLRQEFKDSSSSVRHLYTFVILFHDFVLGRHIHGMLNRFYFSSEMELCSHWIIV